MKDFLLAILEDNPKNERVVGLTDADIIEIYEQSLEVIAFQEEVSLQYSAFSSPYCSFLLPSAQQKDHPQRHYPVNDQEGLRRCTCS